MSPGTVQTPGTGTIKYERIAKAASSSKIVKSLSEIKETIIHSVCKQNLEAKTLLPLMNADQR
jgi:hypothetical protein